jgi:conjugal transfer ATP-binding protein TraC
MSKKNKDKAVAPAATQKYVQISEIRDDTVVLRDGSLRQVIKVTPVSVELRSQQEQEGVVHQFRSFLNALRFPIQVIIQGRRVDLSKYIQKLQGVVAEEPNELLKVQLVDYLDFIDRLSSEVNIMDRSFYVVVPHSKTVSDTSTKKNFLDKLLGGKKTKETVFPTEEFQELRNQLAEKAQIVAGRLESMGIRSQRLKTQELVELYYNVYNPEEASTQRIEDTSEITSAVIKHKTETGLPPEVESILNAAREGLASLPTAQPDGAQAPSVPVPPTNGAPAAEQAAPADTPSSLPDEAASTATPAIAKKSLGEILTRLSGGKHKQTANEMEAEIFKKGLADILDIIAPAGMAINPNHIEIGSFYARTMFVFTYPRYLSSGWLSPIYNLDTTIDVSMFIYPLESSIVMNQLRRKTTQLQSSLQVEQEKNLVRNPELETAVGDIEELRDTLQKGETRLFQYSLYFTIYAKTLEDLQKLTKQIESTLGGMLVYTKQALLQMEQGFNTTLPIFSDELEIVRNLDTDSLATVFPFSSQDISHHDGVLYGINLHNSSLVLFDRFRMENANQVVFAKSGAGKSYAVKLEALRSLMLGTEVIVVDPENEYKALSQTIGGSYIELSLNSSQKINPFDLPHFTSDKDDTGEDLLRTTIASLHGLVSLMAGGLSAEEDALLDKALYETYALKDITVDPKTQGNPPPLLADLVGVLANMTGAESLINRLLKYSEGSFSSLFNAPTNIDLTNRLTVFSIRNMEDELRPLAMYLVLNYIWGRVKSQLKRRLLIIDEAWWMMRYEDTAKFLNAMTKRARKYYLGVTIISQDVEDFVENSYGKAVVSNSATQLLLGQAPSAVDKLAGVFKLTEGEKQFLLTTDVGQGLLVAGIDRAAIQIIASYTEDQFITTDPEQLLMMFGQEAANE